MQSTFEECLKKFFLSPCPITELPQKLQNSGERPTLHLLRRDLENLYRKEHFFKSDAEDRHKAPYLAAMGILTGIDLMAKFIKSPSRESGAIFKNFLKTIGKKNDQEAKFMWELRNALHHSYSLRVENHYLIIFTTAPYRESTNWYSVEGTYRVVNFWGLKKQFIDLISLFQKYLSEGVPEIQEHFVKQYESTGRIFVQSSGLKSQIPFS